MGFDITKCGSFRFWGDWFGRPLDNSHRCTGATLQGDLLMAEFADGESLTVYGAKGITSDEGKFSVADADMIVWEWDLYGEPESDDARRFIEYKKLPDGRIKKTSDLGSGIPQYLDPGDYPAAELY
ncbi:MAG: hypothetical protein IKP95_05380 [Ruminococcus sp.]|nr:hypothetical protein [Ruminococcus sp.]